jgi:hypothetical protein
MRSERVIRIVLVAALAFGTVGVVADAFASFRTVADDGGRPWRESEIDVIRGQGLDPAVLARIAALVPQGATYTVTVAPSLGATVHGQAFTALLRERLLPRLQVTNGKAPWHIIWGAPVPRCCRSWNVGRVHPGDPFVVVVSDG